MFLTYYHLLNLFKIPMNLGLEFLGSIHTWSLLNSHVLPVSHNELLRRLRLFNWKLWCHARILTSSTNTRVKVKFLFNYAKTFRPDYQYQYSSTDWLLVPVMPKRLYHFTLLRMKFYFDLNEDWTVHFSSFWNDSFLKSWFRLDILLPTLHSSSIDFRIPI